MSRGLNRAARLQRIEELLLGSQAGLSIAEMADILDVHRTTVWRDINELSIEIPIVQIENHYKIERQHYVSNIRLNRGESLMLYLALRRIMRGHSHLPQMMVDAMEKLSLALDDSMADGLSDAIQVMRKREEQDQALGRIWDVLVQAWVERITVRVQYQERGCSVIKTCDIQPYLFEPAQLSQSVHLIGYCPDQGQLGMIEVERILSASLTTESFVRPRRIVVESLLHSLWGIWYGDELTAVHLRFEDPLIAERVRRTMWLPTQRIEDLPSGGVDWHASVSDVLEIVPWIRGWGGACQVLAPAELQAIVSQVEENHGGITMTATVQPKKLTFSDEFYRSVMEIFEGEKIKVCLQCSSCSGICPYGFAMEFAPRKMIAALRAGVFDEVMETDSVWMCVSCYACTQVCPAQIPITAGLMTHAKEEMLMAGQVPAELQEALENSQRYGNPLGESPRKRADWAKDLDPEVPLLAKLNRPVEVLWFVGDYASYHPRAQQSARAFAKILQALDVDFAILGPEESSDGDSQRLAGERGLFEMLAEKNGKAIDKYEFVKIVTTDPHAYNAFRNEYPELGINYPVQHYTQFLAERLDEIKPLLKSPVEATVTFHDPCYLGRVNGVFEEPRALLKAIPGVELVEMTHNHENSLCCGGGGGGMWMDGFHWEKAHARLSEWRVREAIAASGADRDVMLPPGADRKRRPRRTQEEETVETKRVLAIACPYEAPRFEDATKTVPEANRLIVNDIAELLAESMDL
ncbi:MAG: WYL domain-containing protein [Anaerolineales bacterium]